MEPDGDFGAAGVDELLTRDEQLAAMPTVAAPIRHQAIAYPFGDAGSIRSSERRWLW
jgi:hypothetical protein